MNVSKQITALIRIFAGRPHPLLSTESVRTNSPTKNKKTSDDYHSVGVFSPPESRAVLELFKNSNVRSQVECDTSAGTVGINGDFWDRTNVEIYAHADDTAKARKIVDDWRLTVGKFFP
jgi:hypothetical protein